MSETAYIYPNGVGDETNLDKYPNEGDNWDKVDDPYDSPDDANTYVDDFNLEDPPAWSRDLYEIDTEEFEATDIVRINFIKVWMRYKGAEVSYGRAKTAIKVGETVYEGDEEVPTDSYANACTQYTDNPDTSSPWTIDDIAGMQIGVALEAAEYERIDCTQVYIEVDYEVPKDFACII